MLYCLPPLTRCSWGRWVTPLPLQGGPPSATYIAATSPGLRSPEIRRPGWLTRSVYGQARPGGSAHPASEIWGSQTGFLGRKCRLCYGNRHPRPRPSDSSPNTGSEGESEVWGSHIKSSPSCLVSSVPGPSKTWTAAQGAGYIRAHFMDGETESQRGKVT